MEPGQSKAACKMGRVEGNGMEKKESYDVQGIFVSISISSMACPRQ
jgi:hypothetical protein